MHKLASFLASSLSWISIVAFVGYFGGRHVGPYPPQKGADLVFAEWPGPMFSPVSMKPITWVCLLAFVGLVSGLEAVEPVLLHLSSGLRRFLFVLAAFVAFGSFYEILFNFSLWVGLMSSTALVSGPDYLASHYPEERGLINIVYAAYGVTTGLAMSIYSTYFLQRLEDKQESRGRD